MKILFPIGECSPLAKVGGLGDVGGSLPKALEKLGVEVGVALPKYAVVGANNYNLEPTGLRLGFRYKNQHEVTTLYQTTLPNSQVKVLLFENSNYLSSGPIHFGADAISSGAQELDRFTFFNLCLVEYLQKTDQQYDLIHAHDWHTGLLLPLLKQAAINLPVVFTVHNMFYQGVWAKASLQEAGVGVPGLVSSPKVGEDDSVNFLVQGLALADRVTTVSPQYAQEIYTPTFGEGLETVLKGREDRVEGILNGIDYQVYDPETDPFLSSNYNIDSWQAGKQANKEHLLQDLGLPGGHNPLFGMVARLGIQKGVEIVLEAAERVLAEGAQLVILGVGDDQQELKLSRFNKRFPLQFKAVMEFNEPLAQQIYAGCDFFLVPSRFEPCGVTQMIAMRYGALPIVRAVGGLVDTVVDEVNGLVFEPYEASFLLQKMEQGVRLFREQPDVRAMMVRAAMTTDWSWADSAKKYVEVYREVVGNE